MIRYNLIECHFSSDRPALEESFGEVSIQVDLFTHPGSGEHKVTVKGNEPSNETMERKELLRMIFQWLRPMD